MDLTDYKLPEQNKGKDLKKSQRLALEIIEWCQIPKQYQGFWWQKCKKHTEFIEGKFNELKRKGIKNSKYLKKLIFKYE